MKTIKLSIAILSVLLIGFSCSSDKQVQLSKLKEKEAIISGKIKSLEEELKAVPTDSLNTSKFKFVAVKEVKSQPFDHFIRVQGNLDGDQNAAVFAEAPGTVAAKFADVGQKVVKGEVLAQIDDQQYISQIQSLETQYKLASDMYDKQQRLWDQKIGSEVQYLQSKTNKESLEKQITSLQQQIDKFKIKSPVDGTVEECNIKVGGVVSPDPRLAAYRVVSFINSKVNAEVSEAYSSSVKPGAKLIVLFPDINKEVETRVDFVSKYINPINRTFIMETKIPDNLPGLKANMLAIIQVNDYHSNSSIQLPMNLIQTDTYGSYVYVVRSKNTYNAAYRQSIVLGSSYNGVVEILDGLKAGDKIISAGYQELVDGQYVRF